MFLLKDYYWIWWLVFIPVFIYLLKKGKDDKRFYVAATIFFLLFGLGAGIVMYIER